jgi:selenoprotein W-related protein
VSGAVPAARPRVVVTYCTRCRWLLRAAWLAQELLSTFEDALGEVALRPAETAGVFEVRVDDHVVWSREADGGFPEAAELKRRVRDRVAPGRALGHADRPREGGA